jgi:hypothetical protein
MDYEHLADAIASGRAADAIPRWSAGVLGDVADGRRDLRAVAHPLGFSCLPVERDGRRGVCVHVWLPGEPVPSAASPAHAHSWDLVSYVLAGRLRNDLPKIIDTTPADTDAWHVLHVRTEGMTDDVRPTPRFVRCEPGDAQAFASDDLYTVPAGIFHNTEAAASAATVTVALGSAVRGASDLSLARPGTGAHRARRRTLGARETRDLARTVIGCRW